MLSKNKITDREVKGTCVKITIRYTKRYLGFIKTIKAQISTFSKGGKCHEEETALVFIRCICFHSVGGSRICRTVRRLGI
jgi:hypothetical protein